MLGKAFNGGLRLNLDGAVHEIRSAGDLDALLRARVAPSGDRLSQLVSLSERDLFASKAACLDQEAWLEELVNAWMSGGTVPVGTMAVPRDHAWDAIMTGVIGLTRTDDSIRFVAVERYRQYLRAVLQCVEGVARGRLNRNDDSSLGRLREPAGGGGQGGTSPAPVQALLFDLQQLAGDATRSDALERLPKGEPQAVRFAPHQSIQMRLARYDFTLVSGSRFLLIDDTGADVRLPGGRVTIGRGSSSAIVLDGRYRSVSRKHVVLDIRDDGTVHFTDVSSMGTFLPAGS